MMYASFVRLHLTTLCDPVTDPAVKKLLLRGIAFADFNVTLPLHDIKNTH